MRSLLIRCYPARWRAHSSDEFEAILEERPLCPFDVADIATGSRPPLAAPGIAIAAVLSISSWDTMIFLFSLSTVAVIAGWCWLGIQAIRQGRRSTAPRMA